MSEHLRQRLAARESHTHAEAWAQLMLNIAPEAHDFDHAPDREKFRTWAECYHQISAKLLRGDFPSGSSTLPDEIAVWGLVYSARSFHLAHRLLRDYPPTAGNFYELGAGLGPFALAARLLLDVPVYLVESEEIHLHYARAWQQYLALDHVFTLKQPATQTTISNAGGIVLPYSLWEMSDQPSRCLELIQHWYAQLLPDARLYIIAPGDRDSAQRLQTLRDLLPRDWIEAPCVALDVCPMSPRDWCHFTLRDGLSNIGQRILATAQRDLSLHFSWLVLKKSPLTKSSALRVLWTQHHGRPVVEATCCAPTGLVRLEAMKRHREIYQTLSGLESGERIELNVPLQPRTRLQDSNALIRLNSQKA